MKALYMGCAILFCVSEPAHAQDQSIESLISSIDSARRISLAYGLARERQLAEECGDTVWRSTYEAARRLDDRLSTIASIPRSITEMARVQESLVGVGSSILAPCDFEKRFELQQKNFDVIDEIDGYINEIRRKQGLPRLSR